MTEIASPLSNDENDLGAQSATAVDAAGSIAPAATPHVVPVADYGCVYHAEQGIPCEHDKALAATARHTEGPWRVRTEIGTFGDVVGPNDEPIAMAQIVEADAGSFINGTGQPHRQANAHLIAAAPDMKAGCERALTIFRVFRDSEPDAWLRILQHCAAADVWDALKAAIAKAEGRG